MNNIKSSSLNDRNTIIIVNNLNKQFKYTKTNTLNKFMTSNMSLTNPIPIPNTIDTNNTLIHSDELNSDELNSDELNSDELNSDELNSEELNSELNSDDSVHSYISTKRNTTPVHINDDMSIHSDISYTDRDPCTIDPIENDLNNLNYSIYVDTKLTQCISSDIDKTLYLKTNEKWIDSSVIYKCQNCNCNFSFITRKHHCRACGDVFCSKCCYKYIEIPQSLISIPVADTSSYTKYIKTSINSIINGSSQLVCNNCYKKINQLIDVEYLLKFFVNLNLTELYNVSQTNQKYNIAAKYYIAKFRDIQYKTINITFDLWEMNIIWNMKNYMIHHNIWYCTLIKMIYIYTHKYHKIDRLNWLDKILTEDIDYSDRMNCWTLMCSRRCMNNLDVDDILDLLEFIYNQPIHISEIQMLYNDINKKIILKLTQLICNNSDKHHRYIPLLCNILSNLLENEIYDESSDNFYNMIFEIIIFQNKNISKNNTKAYKIATLILYEKYYINSIITPKHVFNFFNHISLYINNMIGTHTIYQISHLIQSIDNIINNCNPNFPFINPFNPLEYITNIIERSVIESNTNPILVRVEIKSNNVIKESLFIIKTDINLRKEQLISCLINALQNKLQMINNLDTTDNKTSPSEIPNYRIIMLGKKVGLIEYIENSITLRSINDNGYSLQNYILNQNKKLTIETIKERFVTSLSVSSAISYIIGLGDRHLDNIMINTDGLIFHIDYGYIFENPTTLFEMPQIKITNDIVDFLEGTNSKYYNDFKKNVIYIYNILRANKNILYQYFKFISNEKLLDWSKIQSKLDNRTMTGVKYKDIEILLINEIESANSVTNMIADICHLYRNKQKLI